MNPESYKIFSLGSDAVTVEFGNEIATELNDKAIILSKYFEEKRFAGFVETVPAYASLTVFFDVLKVRKNYPEYQTAFESVRQLIIDALQAPADSNDSNARLIKIPVNFDADSALDLEFVASANNLPAGRVIEIFTAQTYRVFMLGFLPGFAYMGEVDARIATPRKHTPRLIVPPGSVGIAGKQTGIYPFESPGGWQIIGRTDFKLFTPDKENPCALDAGDLVKFYKV